MIVAGCSSQIAGKQTATNIVVFSTL
jgi:hypothetical protein